MGSLCAYGTFVAFSVWWVKGIDVGMFIDGFLLGKLLGSILYVLACSACSETIYSSNGLSFNGINGSNFMWKEFSQLVG